MWNRKLVVARYGDRILTVVYEREQAVSIQVYEEDTSLVGNLYIGKVKNILRNINGAFVEIGGGQICYYEPKQGPVLYTHRQRSDRLCVGDELVVQIEKEAVKTKAPMAKAEFSLTGRYLVLVYGSGRVLFSRKIADSAWKSSCEQFLMSIRPDGCGMIVRTNAYGVSREILEEECRRLAGQMTAIVRQAVYKTCYTRLYQAPTALETQIRDFDGVDEIVTDCAGLAKRLQEAFPGDLVRLYTDEVLPLYKLYALEKLVESCLVPKVWLKSGGYLVIEPTEALTVVDVNSGKYTRNGTPASVHRKMNLEAAAEIARQLRLRNLSGMILVDFIDLKREEEQKELLQYMNQLLRQDPVGAKALDLTRLNLMEITRCRVYRPFYEQMGQRLNWNHMDRSFMHKLSDTNGHYI